MSLMWTRVVGLGRKDADNGGAGLRDSYWWCDRENGVAGMVATQISPFCGTLCDVNAETSWSWERKRDTLIFHGTHPGVLALWANIESAVYKGLKIE